MSLIATCSRGALLSLFTRPGSIFAALAMASLLMPASGYAATTLEELRSNDQLRATVAIETEGDLYERAPFVLAVEVATARWFSRGTRVREVRIPGAVVRPVSSFANNSSRRINGETWTVQRWRFRVFPREAGWLKIPALRVYISVNTEADGPVEGELSLDTAPVEIIAPPGLNGESLWIATPSLTIEQDWEGLRDNYIPGDAITRTRRFVVQDAPAMMLEASGINDAAGLSLYQAPAKVRDRSERGKLTGIREETLVITFEAPGRYQIPGLDYLWFNTTSQTLETLSLPGLDVEVTAAIAPAGVKNKRTALALNRSLLIGSVAALLMLLVLGIARNTTIGRQVRKFLAAQVDRRRAYRAYLRAWQRKDSARCIQLLQNQLIAQLDKHSAGSAPRRTLTSVLAAPESPYEYSADAGNGPGAQGSLRQLLEHAYGEGSALPGRSDAIKLWNALMQFSDKKNAGSRLCLNPGASPR